MLDRLVQIGRALGQQFLSAAMWSVASRLNTVTLVTVVVLVVLLIAV